MYKIYGLVVQFKLAKLIAVAVWVRCSCCVSKFIQMTNQKSFFFSFWQLGFLVAFGNYMKIWRNWLKLNLKLNRCTMYEWECSSSLIRCFVYFCDNCNQKKMAQKHRRTKFFFNIFDNSFAVSDTLLSYCQRRTEVLRVTHEYKFKRIFTLNPWFEVKEK